ncbi:hypothetical protein BKE38_16165 [Pseudoroseomonas deserti]|uniref:DUF423 domain-containing protein n=1 Tax=Teichococcus deserti TaxID=1817963 RepID=A0A1V2H0J4_9PROT|nr:DUF423 domain-containing protein [Pseudoroseomonas deserti]ONG51406.1 hypothetical protein BKE38_16165 [Pseudoroseomonas deserti]
MPRLWLVLGCLSGLLAVGLSAWAAHGLEAGAAARVASAITMQGWHALALLAVGLLAERRPGWAIQAAGTCFTLGMLGFCGALWVGALTGGPARMAPLGGTLLMLGWLVLGLAVLKRPVAA